MKIKRSLSKSFMSIFIAILLVFSCTIQVYAKERQVVRVAFFPMDGYHNINPGGTYGGMDIEYLNALNSYLNWEFKYVKCDSWEDALNKLAAQEVDLVGSAQYSNERAEIYSYADLSSGYTFGVVATLPQNNIAYEDFEHMKNITFGMVENYVREKEFMQYLLDNGIENPNIVTFSSTAYMQNALYAGEIDAYVHTFTEVREGQRLIGRFAPRPFYYITYKGNDDLLRELNEAIADLQLSKPELETDLMNEFYYSRFDKTALLTIDEKEYIKEYPKLRVGYFDGYYPFSYSEEAEFIGLTKELLESGPKTVGFELEYVMLSSQYEAFEALEKGNIDILAYSVGEDRLLQQYKLNKVAEYVDVPLVVVTDNKKNNNAVRTVATVSHLQEYLDTDMFDDTVNVKIYATQEACIDAVSKGLVDAAICDGYLSEHLMRTNLKYSNLKVQTVYSGAYSVSMAIRSDDTVLASILEKTVLPIDYKVVNEYTLRENTYPLVSITEFIKNNSISIITLLIIVLIIICVTVYQMLSSNQKIQKLMYKDSNIDIWNINYFTFFGEQKILADHKSKYAVISLNISKFRRYNVVYGWDAGEYLLATLASLLLKKTDDATEICARNQDDRFVMLLRYSDKDKLISRLEDIKQYIENYVYNKTKNRISLQMGIYHIPNGSNDMRTAINRANQAIDFMNSTSSNIATYDEKLEVLITERHKREKLLDAIDFNNDFLAYYQPKIDIRTNTIVGAEALVRLKDPNANGTIRAPGYFVPYYEQTGKITEVDFFVCEAVCKLLRKRIDAGLPVVTISCNFSRAHFTKEGFVERLEAVLDKYQINPSLIEVEITETLVIEELQQNMVTETIHKLREHGINCSIDDFGAGYSSLGIFEQIPASAVKLDRSFFLHNENHLRQVKIMRGIVMLSNELDAKVVCEGVETADDVHTMEEIGAYIAQGYYYSRPVPEDEFERMLENQA